MTIKFEDVFVNGFPTKEIHLNTEAIDISFKKEENYLLILRSNTKVTISEKQFKKLAL